MQTEPSIPEAKPKSGINTVTLLLSLFLGLFLITAIGLLVYGNNLDAEIKSVQGQEANLQNKYDTLSDEKDATSAELAQTKTNLDGAKASLEETKASLEKAKTDLTNAQTALSKAQDDLAKLSERIDKALKYAEIGVALFVDGVDYDRLQKQHDAVGDSGLQAKYDTLLSAKTTDALIDWLGYLFNALAETLNVN